MTAEQKKTLHNLQKLLGIRKGCQYAYVRFRRGGIYPTGAYYLDYPGRLSDSSTVWLDWKDRKRFEELIRYLREDDIVDHYHDCRDGDSGDGQYGNNPWYIPGNLLESNTVFLSNEAVELLVDF